MNSISYCADCGREIHINSEAFAETVEGKLCVNCREETEVNDLSEHPRCTEHHNSGSSVMVVALGELRIVKLSCGCRMGILDSGGTEKLCPMCKCKSDYNPMVRAKCSYCDGRWTA